MQIDNNPSPYVPDEPYAKVTCDAKKNQHADGVCPKCGKKMKSTTGFLLHIRRCCPDLCGEPYQDRSLHNPKGVWELDLEAFHESLKAIDPKAYFITSGEAVKKTERLCADLKYASEAAAKLLVALKSLKGDAKYLETQWEGSKLLLKQKNPRPTSRISQRTLENARKIKEARAGDGAEDDRAEETD
jgi:hypothetical protein